MAVVNRPVIGTVECFTPGCDEQATVHQVERGNRKGYLYTRCPECKCNQSTGKLFQDYIKENADFREGFDELKVQQPEVAEPDEPETIEVDEPEKEATETRKGAGVVVVGLGLLAGLGLALMGGKK